MVMMYRRLPNTDKARLTAIHNLLRRIDEDQNYDIISSHQLEMLREKEKGYSQLIDQRDTNGVLRKENNRLKQQLFRKLKLCISHFFQVVNFAIVREDLDKSCRTLFGLEEHDAVIPSLVNEQSILHWGNQIVHGENERTKDGSTPISHPNTEHILNLLNKELVLREQIEELEKRDTEIRSMIKVERTKVDECIKKAWNDIEYYFSNSAKENKRIKSKEYGVVYVEN